MHAGRVRSDEKRAGWQPAFRACGTCAGPALLLPLNKILQKTEILSLFSFSLRVWLERLEFGWSNLLRIKSLEDIEEFAFLGNGRTRCVGLGDHQMPFLIDGNETNNSGSNT